MKKLLLSVTVILLLSGQSVKSFAQMEVTVSPNIQYHTTEGWGTSLCWFGNVLGGWSHTNRDEIADLLFDLDTGLGLNLVRYNIGGGDDPEHDHMDYGKEMPGFKASATSPYDWSADANQRWFLSAAKRRIEPREFIAEAFSNSPPYWMTNSGCSSGASNGGNNLNSLYYDDFADYLTEVVRHFRDYWDIAFRTLEPMNEPMGSWWNAYGGQEGCHVSRDKHDDIIEAVKAQLEEKRLRTRISAMDESGVNETIDSYNSYNRVTRSSIYQINTHGYAGYAREHLKNIARSQYKKLWQSESDGSGAYAPFDVWPHDHDDMVPALDIAMRINKDQREMQPDGWILWQAVESEQAQLSKDKNWGLIHAEFEDGTERFYLTKKYYAMAQYSRFIRPGYTMIDINDSDAVAFIGPPKKKKSKRNLSFYTNKRDSHISYKENNVRRRAKDRLVIVQRNASPDDIDYVYDLSGFDFVGSEAKVYRTSPTENFEELSEITVFDNQFIATANAQSITTYVISNVKYRGKNSDKIIVANDNTTGNGLNQFEYVGSWGYGSQNRAYMNDNHWEGDVDGYYQVRFQGKKIEVFGAKASNHGIAAISIDNGSEVDVDFYSPHRIEQSLVYSSPDLTDDFHILTVRVTGTKNPNSSGVYIPSDMVRIHSGSSDSISEIVSGGTYTLNAKHSGKIIEVESGSAESNANVQQNSYTGANHQKWVITHVDDIYYEITALHSGFALTANEATGNVIQKSYWDRDRRRKSYWDRDSQLKNYWDGYAHRHRCRERDNRLWRFESVDGTYNKIINKSTGECLDVSSLSTSNGANVLVWSDTESDNQKWLLTPVSTIEEPAGNPLITDVRTADPSPLVYNGRFYIVSGQDEVDATGFNMYAWHLLSSSDMINWTDHGAILKPSDISWMPEDTAWASHIVHRDGLFYFYASGSDQIGVLVSDDITGPYSDVNGAPLLDSSTPGAPARSIDPMVFVDNDIPYLFYGGDGNCRYVQLNDDMISLAGPVTDVPGLASYLEAPFVIKENGTYFLMYATHPWPSEIRYATSDSIHGPWEYRGVIGTRTGNGTNHEGAAYYNGQWWYTYHNEQLSSGNPYSRSVCVDKMTIDGDTIEPIIYTSRSTATPTRIESYNNSGYYLRHTDFDVKIDSDISSIEDSQFRVVPGLVGLGVSFESVNYPGYYLRHYDYVLYLHKNECTDAFYQDATFTRVPGLADSRYDSYRSYNFPNRYIRHSNDYLRIDPMSTHSDREDATFREVD